MNSDDSHISHLTEKNQIHAYPTTIAIDSVCSTTEEQLGFSQFSFIRRDRGPPFPNKLKGSAHVSFTNVYVNSIHARKLKIAFGGRSTVKICPAEVSALSTSLKNKK